MIDTRRNILKISSLSTLFFVIFGIVLSSVVGIIQVPYLLVSGLEVASLVTAALMVKNVRKRPKISLFDLREKAYPLDMTHNDEREWRNMLTAVYVSQRISQMFLLVGFVACLAVLHFIVSFTLLYLVVIWLPLFFLLVQQWSYTIAYLRLDSK